jgi:hypothetical protein
MGKASRLGPVQDADFSQQVAVGIYTRAILRTGHRIRLREALPAPAR